MKGCRVAILGDTHGWVDERVLETAHSCDHIVHTGDVGGAHVLSLLQATGIPLTVVRGNNDTEQDWRGPRMDGLRELCLTQVLELPGGSLAVIHGHRNGALRVRHAHLRKRFPDCRAVACGHSHLLDVDTSARPWILNPGAGGKYRTYGGPSLQILHANERMWQVICCRFPPHKAAGAGSRPIRSRASA